MPAPKLDKKLAQEAIDAHARYGGTLQAARALGLARGTLETRILAAQRYGLKSSVKPPKPEPPGKPVTEIDSMKDRVFELEAQLKSVRANTLDDQYVARKIIGLKEDLTKVQVPTWALRPGKGDALPGVPSALWSDWHAGERVDPHQINGVNEYNLAIMDDRIRRLVERTVYLLQQHVVNPEYPGLVLNLGGDMLSGDIHDELSETNEQPNMVVLLHLLGMLTWAIRELLQVFPRLFVPCVTGNHGRNTKKPRAKGRNFTNFDWLLYNLLANAFSADDRVQFFIPDGPDALYRVFNHRYLLTHGDQFRGGDGQIGALGPMTRGNRRKQARNAAIDLGYDTMLMGHWHQWVPMLDQITNGSLKGYDEWVNSMNFQFQVPIQGLWLTHPTHGITITLPVYLEERPGIKSANEWVSWREAA